MLDQLYERIGEKIKNLARWIFVVEAISAVIGGIYVILEGKFVFGLCLVIMGPVVAWVSTWLLYAFGELVEKVCSINEKVYILAQPIVEEQRRIRYAAEEKAKQDTMVKAHKRADREAQERTDRRTVVQVNQETREEVKKTAPREKTLAEKLIYALSYQTDEGMIAYLKHIDDETVANILKEPNNKIRELVKRTVENM